MTKTPPKIEYAKCRCPNCDGRIVFEVGRAGEAMACPHCGIETLLCVSLEKVLPWRRILAVAGVALLGIIGLMVAQPRAQRVEMENASLEADVASQPEIALSEIEAVDQWSGRGMKITGVAKNLTSRKLSSLRIRFTIKDDAKRKVDDAIARLLELRPGESWKFEAHSFKDDADYYALAEVAASGVRLRYTNQTVRLPGD